MKPKFKIGDKVKTLKGGYIGKEYIIENIGFNYYKDELVYSGAGSYFYDYELELVQTSEQIAVEKALKEFKEELKEKINKLKEFRIVENIDYGLKEGFGRITYINVVKKDEILELIDKC